MYVARVLYPVEVLGPGKRVGIWFCGCPRRCEGCSNPELWVQQERYHTTPETVMRLVRRIAESNRIDGFTITGGDPMYQPEALQRLISLLRTVSTDILVYTGYQKAELPDAWLEGITVLIDGEYLLQKNRNCFLRGSENQQIYIFDPDKKSMYEDYIANGTNHIQNFMTGDGVVSVGIHKPGFMDELDSMLQGKGVRGDG